MIGSAHAAIVANDKVLAGGERHLRHVPQPPLANVRLFERCAIDVDLPLRDFELLTGQPDDALDVQHVRAGELDGDDVAALGSFTLVGEAVDELERARSNGWLHADPFGANGEQHPAKDDEAERGEDEDSNGGATRMPAKNEPARQARPCVRLSTRMFDAQRCGVPCTQGVLRVLAGWNIKN